MPDCMRELDARGLRAAVLEAARSKPFLGICIGLQMLFEHSAEGDVPVWACCRVRCCVSPPISGTAGQPVESAAHGLESGASCRASPVGRYRAGCAFLFCAQLLCASAGCSLAQASSDYPQPFVCAVARGNLFAVQFHPEKSHAAGLKLLQNFVRWILKLLTYCHADYSCD